MTSATVARLSGFFSSILSSKSKHACEQLTLGGAYGPEIVWAGSLNGTSPVRTV